MVNIKEIMTKYFPESKEVGEIFGVLVFINDKLVSEFKSCFAHRMKKNGKDIDAIFVSSNILAEDDLMEFVILHELCHIANDEIMNPLDDLMFMETRADKYAMDTLKISGKDAADRCYRAITLINNSISDMTIKRVERLRSY